MSLYTAKDQNLALTEATRLGTLGITTIDQRKFTPTIASQKIDAAYLEHDITITKEIDRLVVKGRFKRGTDVDLILYQNMISTYYNIKISKKPYTALCVDVFSEEETANGINVTKYINQERLSGQYSIYLSIDGTIYNTGKYVEY